MKYLLTLIMFLACFVTASASETIGSVSTGVSTGGMEGVVVVTPTATPPAGEYTSTQNVVLSGGEGTASIHYTTDGAGATCTSGSVYSSPIEVASNLFIGAISCYPNGATSSTISFAYAINPPSAPAPSSGGGGGGGGGIITTPETESYDFNSDGQIDIFDFNVLVTNWGSTTASKATGDANGDGKVDIFDFNLLIINWQS